jgi:hypothetical protein
MNGVNVLQEGWMTMLGTFWRLLLGTVFAATIFAGGLLAHPLPTFAMQAQFHCHNLNRIDYWVVTGIDSPNGGVWCVGSVG